MAKIILAANTDWYLYNFRLSLARYLRQHDFEVLLISPPGEYQQRLEQSGFRWRPWIVGRQSVAPWKEITSLLKLMAIYRQEKADLVHQHTIKPVLYGSLAGRWAGQKHVVNSITGRGYLFFGKSVKTTILRAFVKYLYGLALHQPGYATIFENSEDRQYFISQKFTPIEQTWLIPGVGVDPERFVPLPEPQGIPVILYAGRMLWDKGIDDLVQAARILHEKNQVKVVLVGESDPGNPSSIAEDQLNAWVKEGLIEWWRWQPEMEEIYPKCHIFTLPTRYYEGVPTVLLEAAACGRPIVASDMPGCREVVIHDHNGLIIPVDDPEALANAIYKLISDPNLRGRMGNAGRQLILKKYTTQQINDMTLAVYQSVLGNIRPSKVEAQNL